MPPRHHSSDQARSSEDTRDKSGAPPRKTPLGSRLKEKVEQGVEAIVEALGSLLNPEPEPVRVRPAGPRRRPARRDYRFG